MLNFTKEFDFKSGIVLPIDKPYGWTSADVVRKLKWALKGIGHKNIKIGHAGTLDPLATGILLICIGNATKSAQQLQDRPKEYIAEIELGATTPSYDLEKEIDNHYPYKHITEEMVKEVLKGFVGEQQQIPPIFSAKSIDGKRAYTYARNGEEVEMKPSTIEIYNISAESFDFPKITIKVMCSKGTYIRSLARDIAERLNSGGHLTALKRTQNGDYTLSDILQLDDVLEVIKP